MPGKKKAEKRPDPPTQRIDELRGFLDAIESKVGTRPKNVIVGKAYFGDLLVEFCEGLSGYMDTAEALDQLFETTRVETPSAGSILSLPVWRFVPGSDDNIYVTFEFKEIESFI
jgi:hypothetical protein|tara:strand:- start:19208 stop:19549 length:342 start_codon:yes stop_codon:yes gene_type:complete